MPSRRVFWPSPLSLPVSASAPPLWSLPPCLSGSSRTPFPSSLLCSSPFLYDDEFYAFHLIFLLEPVAHAGYLLRITLKEEQLDAAGSSYLVVQVGPDDVLEGVLDPGNRLLVFLVVGYCEDSSDLATERVLFPLVLQQEADRRPHEFRPPCETEGLLNLIHVP